FERRGIYAGQWLAEALAGTWLDRADIVQHVRRAVGKLISRVATGAIQRLKNSFPRRAVCRKRAIRVSIWTGMNVGQRGNVSGQRVEFRAKARFGIAQRLTAGAGVEQGVAHETIAIERASDVILE